MLILTIRTDNPQAELGLYDDDQQLAYHTWEAHRQLAESIHLKLRELLRSRSKELSQLEAVVVYKGPGSFTGLRIGLSVANALAESLQLPIIGVSGQDWQHSGDKRLQAGEDDKMVTPQYGSPPNITVPKK